jgi:hypothetical protein
MRAAISEKIRATVDDRIARWADAVAGAAVKTVPSDFDGGAEGWALFGCSVLEEESMGGDAPGYSPKGEWFGTGDRGNAETPWQLDRRYHAKYLTSGDRTPETDSAYAMALLSNNWKTFSDVSPPELRLKATAAGYNASLGRVRAALDNGQDPDLVTYPRAGGQVYATEIVGRLSDWRAA